MDLSPVVDFTRFFRVIPANTEELRNAGYRLRYRVYCLEFGYEAAGRFPDGLECDEYDPTALHCLVIHNSSDAVAACVRLVPGSEGDEERRLPLEGNCADSLDRAQIDNLRLPRRTICEVSRLAVDPGFRRRRGEQLTRFGDPSHLRFDPAETRTLPLIAVSTYLAATAMTAIAARTNVFAMMEPFLPRLMDRVGIHFQKVGATIEYHGWRAPYFIQTGTALQTMVPELRGLYGQIHGQLCGRQC